MNSALRRVAGGRTTKLTSNASICRSRGYSTAVSLEGERVRRAVEKVIAGQSGKTPDDDLNSLRSRLAAGETSPAVTESHDYSNKDPQLGDYPVVPWTNNQRLPPNGWWDNQARRNYGDPVHEYDEVVSMWSPDVSGVPPQTALRQFTVAMLGFAGFALLTKYALVPDKPAVPREYPYSGLVTELGGLEENKAREEDISGDE